MRKNIKIIVICILTLLAMVSVVQGIRNALAYPAGSFDFQYDSAKLFSMRINPYDESLEPSGIADELGLTMFYGKVEANQFPSLLMILVPFTIFQPYIANILWVVINMLLTIVSLFLMKKMFYDDIDDWISLCLSCIMLAGLGWRNNIGNGQHTIFAFAFFLIALWLSKEDHAILSGLALALSLFKYTLTIPLAIYLIYKKRYKEIVVAGIFHIALTFIGAWWLKDSIINMIVKPLKISSMLSSAGYIDFGSVLSLPANMGMLLAMFVLLGILILAFMRCHDKTHELTLFVILSYVSLIIIYHRAYDFFILIVPVGIMCSLYLKSRKWKIPLGCSIFIFLYSNFVEKFLHLISNRVPASLSVILTKGFAFFVYGFVICLIVLYVGQYRVERRVGRGK